MVFTSRSKNSNLTPTSDPDQFLVEEIGDQDGDLLEAGRDLAAGRDEGVIGVLDYD